MNNKNTACVRLKIFLLAMKTNLLLHTTTHQTRVNYVNFVATFFFQNKNKILQLCVCAKANIFPRNRQNAGVYKRIINDLFID